jgi:hypothetical protein
MTSLASTSGDGLDSWERLFDDVDLTKCGGTGLGIKYGEASKVRQANAILSRLKTPLLFTTPSQLLRSIHLHTHTHNTQPDAQHNTTRPRSRP